MNGSRLCLDHLSVVNLRRESFYTDRIASAFGKENSKFLAEIMEARFEKGPIPVSQFSLADLEVRHVSWSSPAPESVKCLICILPLCSSRLRMT
jgi:hypothetical protein